MSEFGIKVAIKGKSVSSADPNDFTLHSKYNTLKIAEEGYGTITIPDSIGIPKGNDVDIVHGLGYNPFFLAFYHIDDGVIDLWFPCPSIPINAYGGGAYKEFSAGYTYPNVNTVNLTFAAYQRPQFTIPYKYYVFIDPYKEAWDE